MYFKRNVVKQFGDCQHCGSYAKNISYQGQKFGHLYFIPLIPMGSRSQILNECSACDMGVHIPLTDAEPMVNSLREQFKNWVVEIQDGKTEIIPEDQTEPVNVGVLIADMVETMYSLNEIKDIDSISQILTASELEYENNLVMARWSEMRGRLSEAAQFYYAASQLRPEDPTPLYQLGRTEMRQGNTQGAEAAFGKCLELRPDDIGTYIELASIYEANRDYPQIVKTYDRLYSLHPALVGEKAMKKVYKKACKKSGMQGEFLNQV